MPWGAEVAPYHLLAAAFALLLPFMLFVSRALVRKQRSAAFQDLMRSLFPQGGSLPQLDLVGAKYDSPSIEKKPGDTTRRKRQSNGPMLAAAVFALLTFAGFELLLVPISALMEYATSRLPHWQFAVAPAFVWTNGGAGPQALNNAVAIACMAFLGAYIAAARFLAKQAWNFELDAMSFLRSSLLLIMGVVIALVA